MNVADRKQATAPVEAKNWLARLQAALAAQDAAAVADLFLPDGLWRDVLAFTWTIQTMAGRGAIEAMLRDTLARTKPTNFHIPSQRTPPRWVARAGHEAIEALFELRDRVRSRQRGGAARARRARGLARLDAEHKLARIARPRRSVQAPRRARFDARLRRRELARPPRRDNAPLPTAIRRFWWSAAARPGCRLPPASASSASIR